MEAKTISAERLDEVLSILNGRGPLKIEPQSAPRLNRTGENCFECLVNTKQFQVTIRQGQYGWASIVIEAIKATSS